MADDITTITRDIADGERFSHTGPVELQGNVGKGAIIDIAKGGILIKGSVADGANIGARGGSGNVFIGGSIVGGTITVNGRTVSGGDFKGGLSGIRIEKQTGSGVMLETDGSITLGDKAGDRLRAAAGGSFTGGNLGAEAGISADGSVKVISLGSRSRAKAGGSFKAKAVGPNNEITAGGSADIDEVGNESNVNADGSARIGKIGEYCTVKADGSATVESVGPNSHVDAGGSARIALAHASANIQAGGSRKIGRTSNNDAEFSLSAAFSGSAAPPVPKKNDGPTDDKTAPGKPRRGFNL